MTKSNRIMESRKGIRLLLIILSILASLKMLLFAFGLDEEYQVVMAYRNATGDKLFLDMWEPHQSSAFLCMMLMKPWLLLFGTTGVVLYLRVCGTLIHLGISVYFYRVMKDFVREEYAWLLALIYFNTIPKQIMLPEFGIMQVWFYTLLSLFLIRYYVDGRKVRYLVLAALALVLNVLSYPSCLILFPFVLLVVARLSEKDRWRDMGIVFLVCTFCAAIYLGILFIYTNPKELVTTLSHILNGDVTHSLAPLGKMLALIQSAVLMGLLWLGCRLAAVLITKWRNFGKEAVFCITVAMSCVIDLIFWILLNRGYESMQLHLPVFALEGVIAYRSLGRETDIKGSETDKKAKLLQYCMLGALLSLVAVVYLTDLSLVPSVPHAMPAAFFGAVLLIFTLERAKKEKLVKWGAYFVLTVWGFTAVLGKGYTLRGGVEYNNVLQSGGILKYGPAAGTISSYMGAYVYNCDYEDWNTYLQDGDRVLIMVDQVMNLGTIQYLFKNVEISHFSVVNPTAYDERLLEYWELYPEKMPNVIIVDCWYGQLMTDPNGWMMQYIENDFGYSQVNDGRYIRIFRK